MTGLINIYMRVYRVESKKYPKKGRTDCVRYLTNHWWHLPDPYDDGLGIMKPEEVCGTTSKSKFYKWWFKSKLKNIISSAEAQIVLLNVPKKYVKRGKHQCIFPRSKATIIGTLNEYGQTVYHKRKSK